MLGHFNYEDQTHPERPDRIRVIYKRLQEFGIIDRCYRVKARQSILSELEDLHSPKHLRMMAELSSKKPDELTVLQENYNSVYLHRHTNDAALIAAGSVVALKLSVLDGDRSFDLVNAKPARYHCTSQHEDRFSEVPRVVIIA
ncbi:hypothetical protein SK128_025331 [Halocaridina rubra]|uniref:Histone deacetylase domain-containing protein n=1 Tax=Halocaridina rubra TaxID=373956 RepID=A0AAN9A3U8_HALRR